MPRFVFTTDCVSASGHDINEMVARGREVTLRTFRKHCDTLEWETALGYERAGKGGLALSNDWHVAYFRSTYRGRPCYYAVHSAIEHVFTETG